MLIVPIQPLLSQSVNVILNNQTCTINITQRTTGLFVDLYVTDVLIIGGVIAQNKNVIVRSVYLGFSGDIAFIDTQGDTDPVSSGLGSRFVLAYYGPTELPPGLA